MLKAMRTNTMTTGMSITTITGMSTGITTTITGRRR